MPSEMFEGEPWGWEVQEDGGGLKAFRWGRWGREEAIGADVAVCESDEGDEIVGLEFFSQFLGALGVEFEGVDLSFSCWDLWG